MIIEFWVPWINRTRREWMRDIARALVGRETHTLVLERVGVGIVAPLLRFSDPNRQLFTYIYLPR